MSRFGVRTLLISTQFPAKLFNTRLISSKTRYKAFLVDIDHDVFTCNLEYYTGELWILARVDVHKSINYEFRYKKLHITITNQNINISFKHISINCLLYIQRYEIKGIPQNLHSKVMTGIAGSLPWKSNNYEVLINNMSFLKDITCESEDVFRYYLDELHLIQGIGEVKTFDIDDVPDIID